MRENGTLFFLKKQKLRIFLFISKKFFFFIETHRALLNVCKKKSTLWFTTTTEGSSGISSCSILNSTEWNIKNNKIEIKILHAAVVYSIYYYYRAQTFRAHTGTTKAHRKKKYGISFISVFCVSVCRGRLSKIENFPFFYSNKKKMEKERKDIMGARYCTKSTTRDNLSKTHNFF